MIDQFVLMATQLIHILGARRDTLTEYEHELYENLCRMISSHCKVIRLANEFNIIELESDLTHKEKENDCVE